MENPATFHSAPCVAEITDAAAVQRVPWYVWCLAAAVSGETFGLYWEISWHVSIGRDTFWAPAHMVIWAAGALAGISCGYAIFRTTFGASGEAKNSSVSIWGFRGPLGCFFAMWGAFAMLTSALFDNWWHNAYGLEVRILSLPHSMLATGEGMIALGAILLACAHLNRAPGVDLRKLDWLLLWIGGIVVAVSALFILESTPMEFMHNSKFYCAVAASFPAPLIAISVVSKNRWPATTMAASYTALFLAGLWIFPLFPAAPKLGPVYQHITHMVPLWFPVLLIGPAFALDLLRTRMGADWGSWKSALAAGCVFIAAFVAAQWPFADFLISPAARNPIFGANYFGFFDPAGSLYNPYHFVLDPTHAAFGKGMAIALMISITFCSLGMALGNWMLSVRR